jgi:AraC-like DNA-binding protein
MQNARNFPIGTENELPLDISVSRGIDPGTSMLHKHGGFEINYFLEGSAQYLIGGRRYGCRAGDIVMIGNEETHRAYDGDDALILVLLLRPDLLVDVGRPGWETKFLTPFWGIGRELPHLLPAGAPGAAALAAHLEAAERESRERGNSYRLMVKVHLLAFAAELTRLFGIPDNSTLMGTGALAGKFAPVLEHIERHLARPIKVDELAALANLSVSQFDRAFKRVYGLSPIEALMRARVVQAARLIAETDTKVIDAALATGFASMSHFIKCFRRYTGQVPRDYRRQVLGAR